MAAIEVQSTSETGLMPYAAPQVEEYRPAVMTASAAKALDDQVRACTRAVLREGTDYGIIPGTNGEKTLWRPGAQKLLQWFGFSVSCERVEVERDDDGRKHGITYRATVTRRLPDGSLDTLATCEGTADYDESKFYQSAEEAQRRAKERERRNAETYHRPANPMKWQDLGEYRADWNALMKRAQKRAIVGAVVDATAAGGIFSDREEDDSRATQPDGGPDLAARMLDEAAAFTTQAAAERIWRDAAAAAREGLITPGQATHVQNRARVRLKSLTQAAQPVHVGDLARQAAKDTSPADEQVAPVPAVPSSPATKPAGEAPMPPLPGEEDSSGPAPSGQPAGDEPAAGPEPDEPSVSTPQLTAIWTLLTGAYAFSNDEKPQARKVCAHIIGRELGSTKDMSKNEARTVLDTLANWRATADEQGIAPRDYLVGVMAAGPGEGDG